MRIDNINRINRTKRRRAIKNPTKIKRGLKKATEIKLENIGLTSSFNINSYSQSVKDLENKKLKNEKEIEYINKLLKESSKSKNTTYHNLVLINEKLHS